MTSKVQKLKQLVAVKVGRRKPRLVESKKLARALEDAHELVELRRQVDRELARKQKIFVDYVAGLDVPPHVRKVTFYAGERQADVRLSNK
ncbi:MAG: hypothetical protein V3W11_04305 [bacterium]